MKPDDILDAIGNVDDEYIKNAEKKKKPHRAALIAVGSLAACLILALLLPGILPDLLVGEDGVSTEDNISYTADIMTETEVAWDDVWIYYVDDANIGDTQYTPNGEINKVKEYLPLSPEDIFKAWKDKNSIGDDVKLIAVRIDSNSTTTESEFEGEGVVKHEIGDHFIYNITVSKSIEHHYDDIDSALLLQSLKQTMTGYSNLEYDEYNLTLE